MKVVYNIRVYKKYFTSIQLNFFSENEEPKNLEFGDFFYGLSKMIKTFSEFDFSGSQLISNEEIFKISKIVIAGQISIEVDIWIL